MSMFNYGVGGQEVKQDASEAITDLSQNRTLFVQKLTHEEQFTPQVVYDLKTVDEVFNFYKPEVPVEFENADGTTTDEQLKFSSLSDFSMKGIVGKSPFLQGLAIQKEQHEKLMKQLKNNKPLQSVINNPDTKAAFINALKALITELDESK